MTIYFFIKTDGDDSWFPVYWEGPSCSIVGFFVFFLGPVWQSHRPVAGFLWKSHKVENTFRFIQDMSILDGIVHSVTKISARKGTKRTKHEFVNFMGLDRGCKVLYITIIVE